MKNTLLYSLCILIALTHYSVLADTHETEDDATQAIANFPETEIFIFDIDLKSDANILSNGFNATQRRGYDNQPVFTPDSNSFVYSRDDSTQTDVYEYDLTTSNTKRLTNSNATEFSPTPTPDNSAISFVSDRNASIWVGERGTIDKPKWLLAHTDNREPIGYYAWNHSTGDILYWSQYGFSISLTHESEQTLHYLSGNAVPSTPQIIPNTNHFSFVHRQSNGQLWIKAINPKTRAITPITPTVGNNANYTWAPDGSILMIEQNVLYRNKLGESPQWYSVANLDKAGIAGGYRLAISPNSRKLAIVGLPNKPS